MKLYADVARFRNRQVLQDLALLLWIVLWVRIGLKIDELVNRLATPGETIERAGTGFSDTLRSISERVGDLPVVGEALRAPFEAAAEAGLVLQRAGAGQQEVVHTLAVWLGVLFAVIPISYVVYRYAPDRLRWVREASAAEKLRIDAADLRLFALRALATKPLYELKRAVPDPAAAFEAGDFAPLAGLELASLGLKVNTEEHSDPR